MSHDHSGTRTGRITNTVNAINPIGAIASIGRKTPRYAPRVDRMRVATAAINSRNPLSVRYRDELRMPYGTFKVCRIARVLGGEDYICTDGQTTRRISSDEVGKTEHYRDGDPVNRASIKNHW